VSYGYGLLDIRGMFDQFRWAWGDINITKDIKVQKLKFMNKINNTENRRLWNGNVNYYE
jgi:hypothetical protein